jgi:hypothetical protein
VPPAATIAQNLDGFNARRCHVEIPIVLPLKGGRRQLLLASCAESASRPQPGEAARSNRPAGSTSDVGREKVGPRVPWKRRQLKKIEELQQATDVCASARSGLGYIRALRILRRRVRPTRKRPLAKRNHRGSPHLAERCQSAHARAAEQCVGNCRERVVFQALLQAIARDTASKPTTGRSRT